MRRPDSSATEKVQIPKHIADIQLMKHEAEVIEALEILIADFWKNLEVAREQWSDFMKAMDIDAHDTREEIQMTTIQKLGVMLSEMRNKKKEHEKQVKAGTHCV